MAVELPLLANAGNHSFTLLTKGSPALVPARRPNSGEQYRFHFDMTKCIGCRCCVVACNEQNGNPAHLNWRRVGELEGGIYPAAQRWHLSMGCNHCLEPSCLIGCPVEAYTKDSATGIVDHDPDQCIGCQYCTWNCSYGVPQFNAERGVVGKCDMCHKRLNAGGEPACVNACPEGAITIEIVDQAEWRQDYSAANSPGMPPARDSLSTTRITLPANLNADRVDDWRATRGQPHWSLVGFLVATQFAAGAFFTIWLLEFSGAALPAWSALVPLLAAKLALAAAPLHLGRPAFAWRAIQGWKTSWVSREILAMSLFAGLAALYALAMYFGRPERVWAGAATVVVGFSAVAVSARIYMVPARPSWNRPATLAAFFLTALVTGLRAMPGLAVPAGFASVAALALRWRETQSMAASESPELRASASIAAGGRWHFYLGLAALFALPLDSLASLVLALASEVMGRYVFFVSAVPRSMASTFLKPGGEVPA